MEISIRTEQYIPMFAIMSIDGQLYQNIGHAGDYTVLEAIDYDKDIVLFDLDIEAIQEFISDEGY
jgi:hypothetical protein